MRLALHTFRKDVRLLRWPLAAVLALQLVLAWQDRWRADPTPNSIESWLNLILPLAWVCLLGLTVEQESLADDRQFWITRPHRWPALLGAKLLFAFTFIHLPAFLADCWILAEHGFQPWHFLPQLLGKQALIAGALTLPSVAVATLVKNFSHFMLAMVALAAGLALVSSGLWRRPVWNPGWMPVLGMVRQDSALLVAAIGAAAILWMQYSARRTWESRAVGIATAVIAASLLGFLPLAYAIGLHSAMSPGNVTLSLRIDPTPGPQTIRGGLQRAVNLWIPVVISGIPAGMWVRALQLDLEVFGPDGLRYGPWSQFQAGPLGPNGLLARLNEERSPEKQYLHLTFDRAAFHSLEGRKVRIKGTGAVSLYQHGETSNVPVGGSAFAAGVGRCASFTVPSVSFDEAGMFKVMCESPSEMPQDVWGALSSRKDGQSWKIRLHNNSQYPATPAMMWLSPLDRATAALQLGNHPEETSQRWMVPVDTLTDATFSITPTVVAGYSLLTFELKDVRLSDFAPQQPL